MSLPTAARPRFFYGWIVVAIAFVTMGVSITARSSFSLLFPEILNEFQWDRGTTAGAYSIGYLASTALLPVVGLVMDRYGPRLMIPIGALLVGSGLYLMTTIETAFGLYMTVGLLVVNGSMAMSYIVHSIFLPRWFVRNSGLAVGIAFSGVGVLSFILLPLIQGVIETSGWRWACVAMAVVMIFLIIPLNALFQRASPEAMGLEPDGDGAAGSAKRVRPDTVVDRTWAQTEWTVARAVRTGRFWWLSISMFCGLFVWYGTQVHQTKFLTEAGFDSVFAATALGLVAFFGIGGQIGMGWLSDRIGREIAWTISGAGFVVSSALFIVIDAVPSVVLVYTMIVAQGLFGNGLAALFGAAITEVFSGRRLASILSLITLCGNLGAGGGAWLLGLLYDVSGTYVTGFMVCVVFSLISIVGIWFAAPRKVRLVAGMAERRQRAADGQPT